MIIASIVDIVGGELRSNPFVTSAESVQIHARKVERGDIYIATPTDNQIELAIANGAYVIIYDDPSLIPSDPEVAWIFVESSTQAFLKFTRYFLRDRSLHYLYTEEKIEVVLHGLLRQNRNVLFLNHTIIETLYELLYNPTITLCISNDKHALELLGAEIDELTLEALPPYHYEIKTLFSMRLFIADLAFNIDISPYFARYIACALHFCLKHHYHFDITKLTIPNRFQPLFINRHAERVEYGQSNRVVIIDTITMPHEIHQALAFLETEARWATVALFLPRRYETLNHLGTIYHSQEALLKALKISSADILYCVIDHTIHIETLFQEKKTNTRTPSLF